MKEKNLLTMGSRVSLDAVLKDFFQRKEKVADLLNAVLFDGDGLIRYDMVETMDSDSSSVIEIEKGSFITGKRQRDKLVCIRLEDGDRISLGLEFQSTVDYDMILRIFFYTSDFLSREQKLDEVQFKLINLVLFSGEGKWSAKTSLRHQDQPHHSGYRHHLQEGFQQMERTALMEQVEVEKADPEVNPAN